MTINVLGTNSMTINVRKTQCMWFGPSQKVALAPGLSLKIGMQQLQEVKSYKYLGATLDTELTLSKFADDINRKITNNIFKLANLRYMMDEQTAITI